MKTWMLGTLALAGPAAAQCTPQWSGLGMGCNWEVRSMEVDPYLPAGATRLLVVGYFGAAGPGPADSMAAWDGREWSTPLGQLNAPQERIDDAAVVPSGSFPAPRGYSIGGTFTSVAGVSAVNAARWDKAWGTLADGAPQYVYHLGVYDERPAQPGGDFLYLGGAFAKYLGQPANSILRWDGESWSPLSPTLTKPNNGPSGRPTVHALTIYDDDGPLGKRPPGLYVGGWHKGAGTIESRNIIRWDGVQWEGLEWGLGDTVYSICAFDDDGPGPRPEALFASGSFIATGGGLPAQGFARWDGHAWSAPPSLNSNARAMLVWDDDGPGPDKPALYAAGLFSFGAAKWRGAAHQWEPLGTGLSGGLGITYGLSLCAWDEDGPGPNPGGLYVGGQFTFAGGVETSCIARWGCPLPPGGPCYADCDQDGVLNLSDFGCFTTKFALGDAYADCNNDGQRNLSDFGCFQTKFALGCP
ncbi:MAG: hypothetical protein IT437_13670 [Phycisphaerales bacterium]|nr:hypothetical protein [Phycisphaerales bacterium]